MINHAIKRRVQKGFTLLELMIVITIIGILATFAVPAFQDYTARARIGEGLVFSVAAKEHAIDNLINGLPPYTNWSWSSAHQAQLSKSFDTENLSSISIQPNAEITITPNWKRTGYVILYLTPYVKGVPLTPSNMASGSHITWKCSADPISFNDTPNRLPPECRNLHVAP